jgi:hypothetical protein
MAYSFRANSKHGKYPYNFNSNQIENKPTLLNLLNFVFLWRSKTTILMKQTLHKQPFAETKHRY